jgi:hypothetical protein
VIWKKAIGFIWRRPEGSFTGRGGTKVKARIPSIKVARDLMKAAQDAGWGKNEGEGCVTKVRTIACRPRTSHMSASRFGLKAAAAHPEQCGNLALYHQFAAVLADKNPATNGGMPSPCAAKHCARALRRHLLKLSGVPLPTAHGYCAGGFPPIVPQCFEPT